jgi:hypothetical protein
VTEAAQFYFGYKFSIIGGVKIYLYREMEGRYCGRLSIPYRISADFFAPLALAKGML